MAKNLKTNNRTAQVRLHFTPQEKETAFEHAKNAGLTLSDYSRKRILGMPVKSKTDAMMRNELRRLGGLLKLIHSKTNGVYEKAIEEVLAAIEDAIPRIGE